MSAKQTKQHQNTKPVKKAAVVETISTDTAVTAKRMMWFLFAAGFLLFMNTLGHGFVLDDVAVIESNKFVQQGFSGIPKILSTFYWQGYWDSNAGLYRPLSLITFAIEYGISPNNPFIHHFVNVLLYATTMALLFNLLKRMLPGYSLWISFFITLLFAVHPIHTEVVANIKSRDELLCFLFFVLVFHFILKNGLSSTGNKLIAAGLFLLCLLSKEAGILFLPVIGGYFILFRKETILKTTALLFPLIAVSIAWICLHQYIIQSSPFERIIYTYHDNSLVGCSSASAQTATGIAILGRYLMKAVFPHNMSYDYSYNEIPCETFGSPLVIISIIVMAALAFVIYRSWKTIPAVSFGLLFFFITILMVTNIFSLIGTTMGDRLLYAPVLGICIALVCGVYHLAGKAAAQRFIRPVFYGFAGIALIASVMSFQRNRDWESNVTLYSADVANAPNSARVHYNYAVILMSQLPEDIERQSTYLPKIISTFNKALAIDSLDGGSYVNLGVCYYRLKQYGQSVAHTRKAMAINPNDTGLYTNLADAYFKLNELDSAITYYNKAIAANNVTQGTYNFLGVAWFNKKEYVKAAGIFQKGLKQFPDNEEMLMNLGNTYGMSKNYEKAIGTFNKVVALNPNNKQAYYYLALTYQAIGDPVNTQKNMEIYNAK